MEPALFHPTDLEQEAVVCDGGSVDDSVLFALDSDPGVLLDKSKRIAQITNGVCVKHALHLNVEPGQPSS